MSLELEEEARPLLAPRPSRFADRMSTSFTDALRPTAARRTRLWAFPATRQHRWLMRLGFAVPVLGVGSLAAAARQQAVPNTQLLERAASLSLEHAGVGIVGDLYPPVTTVLALLVHPFGAVGLSFIGALVAGVLLQKMVEAMVQRRLATSTIITAVVALAANPLFLYTATQNLPAFLALSLFAIGMGDLWRFAIWRDTQSGFRAGILLMLAALSDGAAILYVLVATLTAPLLALGRRERGASLAQAVVILFPTLSAFGAVALLDLVFTGSPLGSVRQLVSLDPARLQIFPYLVTTPTGILVVAPVLCAWALALVVRRPGAIVVSVLLFAAQIGGYLVGLIPASSAGNSYILMIAVAAALTPPARRIRQTIGLNLLLLLQVGIAWESAMNRDVVVAWMHALLSASQR